MHHKLISAAALFLIFAVPQLSTAADGVTVRETDDAFTLDNGIISARILKRSGDIRSLRYKGDEIFTSRSGHAGGYWSHDTTGGVRRTARVTIDPKTNKGQRAEVAIKGISGGRKMGHGPGAASDGDFPADIEIRYALEAWQSGIYTYCIFDHLPEYGSATMTEARFAVKLASFFDWMSVDRFRNKHYPRVLPGEDKYVYTAVQSENRAYGFSSTSRKLGFYFINPSVEYLSGGPTKPEFLCHRDTTSVQAPVVLNYWRSSHYGGANVPVEAGEAWTKVIGPFLLYVNQGADPQEMYRDTKDRAVAEAAKWPYAWVDAKGYTKPADRSTVRGRLVLNDPLVKSFPGKVMVGLTHPAYTAPGWRGRRFTIDWQTDAKHYQFWTQQATPDGTFEIPDVPPGSYTLHAMADGVLGELTKADIKIEMPGAINLGEIKWKPQRRGRQLWEIGVPDRSAMEFAAGKRFFEPGIGLQYPELFPEGVNYEPGRSSPGKDWFFAHVPRVSEDFSGRPSRGGRSRGRATPYNIRFNLAEQPTGDATLRLAICGTSTRSLEVAVNGKSAGRILLGRIDGVITKHQVQGLWYEREHKINAALLRKGDNTLTLTVPAGSVTAGVVYDYLRLEMADDK